MEEILSRARKVAEQAEVFQVISRNTPVKFEANRLKQIQTKESVSTALRLIKNGRVGFAQMSGNVDADELVAMALETSQFGDTIAFDFPGSTMYQEVKIYDNNVAKISLDTMVETGTKLIDSIRNHTPEIVCEASVVKGNVSVHLVNSNGGAMSYEKSYFSAGIEGVIVKDNEMLFVGDSQNSCTPNIDTGSITETVLTQLELSKRKAGISGGTMPVIFKPDGVASALLSSLAVAFNGKVVFNGASPLKDKLNKSVFDEKLSLWDDATIPYQISSCPCDDEGVPGQKTMLIDHGVVSHFLYDLQTASLMKSRSTGNGSRNGGLPTPSPNSIIISKGTISFQEMVKNIKQGLIVEQLMGAEQGNVLNGDFSGNVLLGYKIENGEITGRVKDTMVTGNVYRILKSLEAIGNDARWIGGFLNTPSLYCAEVPVATKGG